MPSDIGMSEMCLLLAVLQGNADRAIEVIERGCKLDISYFDGCNPLIKSANYGM